MVSSAPVSFVLSALGAGEADGDGDGSGIVLGPALGAGDPGATAGAILKIVDAQEPPLRIFFGSSGLPMTRAEYVKRMETWEQWNDLSLEAQGDSAGKRA